MTFVEDSTIGEGELVQPNTEFVKTWRIRNSGMLINSLTAKFSKLLVFKK